MSFRRRLTLFFVVIVVVPMVALGAIVVELAGSSETGKADAALSAALDTALNVYGGPGRRRAGRAAGGRGSGPRRGDPSRRRDGDRGGSSAESQLVFAEVVGPDGAARPAGEDEAVAPVELDLGRTARRSGRWSPRRRRRPTSSSGSASSPAGTRRSPTRKAPWRPRRLWAASTSPKRAAPRR